MLQKLFQLFSQPETTPSEHDLTLASAALLVEVMRADHNIDSRERQSLASALQSSFALSADDAEELLCDAEQLIESSNDLHQFTKVVHAQTSEADKFQLLVNLWRVAFADNELDKYEEHLIRRIAELLYIPHSDFIRAKILARDSQ